MTMHSHSHGGDASIAGVVSLVVLVVGLAVTAAEFPMAWVVWPLGYGVFLPLAVGLAARRETDSERETTDPVSDLHDRYVAGDIDEREFERKLETALAEEDDGTA